MTKKMIDCQSEVREWTIRKGWRGVHAPVRTFGEDMALLHSEVSEAVEAYRLKRMDRWSVWDDGSTLGGVVTRSVPKESFDYHGSKPEGVASELADVLIRLLDNYAEWDLEVSDSEVDWVDEDQYKSFGDAASELHERISSCYSAHGAFSEMTQGFLKEIIFERFEYILRELQSIALFYEINLYAEYEAKMAYNETRSHRHGGKNL